MKKLLSLTMLLLLIFAYGCKRKDDPKPIVPTAPSLKLSFKNFVGNDTLSLNKEWYQNANGDSFSVTMYKYYISNIVLTKDDGSQFIDTNGYYLINSTDAASKVIDIKNITAGSYTKIQFLVGVDSLRNVSGAQTGALDPFFGMFWDWNSGYIMAKLEGNSPQSPNLSKQFVYHVGGFTGENNVLKTIQLTLPQKATVVSNSSSIIEIKSDVLEWFKSPTTISINSFPGAMNGGKPAKTISDNYADMFTITSVITLME